MPRFGRENALSSALPRRMSGVCAKRERKKEFSSRRGSDDNGDGGSLHYARRAIARQCRLDQVF